MSPSFLMGLGIGLLMAALLMTAFSKGEMSDYELEKRARDMGMIYPAEIKAVDFYGEAIE